jgi:ABC-type polysaccharide/polyol phosphate export permease
MPFPGRRDFAQALGDMAAGLRKWRIWLRLALYDIKLRYRRTLLGPFWITIQTTFQIVTMGFLFAKVFGAKIEDYFPHLTCGLVLWGLIAGFVNNAGGIFFAASPIIVMGNLPHSLHVYRRNTQDFLTFCHNLLPLAGVLVYFGAPISLTTLLVIPGFLMVILFGLWASFILACLCLRYHDLVPAVSTVMTMMFYLTPIMWESGRLGAYRWIVYLNPFYHLLHIVRGPLLHMDGLGKSFLATGIINVVGCLLAVVMYARSRGRLAYWL